MRLFLSLLFMPSVVLFVALPSDASCLEAKEQHPIFLNSCKKMDFGSMIFNYNSSNFILKNIGHYLEAEPQENINMTLGNISYKLMQVHFHNQSLHVIDEARLPLEIHFVHKNSAGDYLVLAVTVMPGKSTPLANKISAAIKSRRFNLPIELMLKTLLPEDQTYFSYLGNLGGDSCTSNVKWIVMRQPIKLSSDDIKTITNL